MRSFDVQSISIRMSQAKAFQFIADPTLLPRWAEAFESAEGGAAVLRTPSGAARVALRVDASPEQGTIDWHMTFPDGNVAAAYSRLVGLGPDECVYSFVLTPPPVPLEELEGALEEQSRTLARELMALKGILESSER